MGCGQPARDRGGEPLIRFGPAGWSYPDSPGFVYPKDVPARFDVLAYLAGYFDTVEVNATFYRPQPRRNYESWARRTAHNPAFRFAVKLWQRFTHERGGPWTADDVRQVTPGLDSLAKDERLGAVLVQFPWSFRPGGEADAWLDQLVTDFRVYPLVVEVRHSAWNRPAAFARLRAKGVGFANIDQPVIGESLPPTAHATSRVGYVRFHGRNYENWFRAKGSPEDAAGAAQRYDYLYSADELAPWVERIRGIAAQEGVSDVYVISNNHYQGKGPANALMLRAMLEGRGKGREGGKIPAPPALMDAYRAALESYAFADAR